MYLIACFCSLFFLLGIFVAAHDLKIEWVIVKGVSCIADGSRAPDDSWKSFAGVMAASVVFNMLTDPTVFRQWPHYQGMSQLQLPPPPPPRGGRYSLVWPTRGRAARQRTIST